MVVEKKAVVADIDGADVLLELVRDSPCSLCGHTRGCGNSMWQYWVKPHDYLRAANTLGVTIGSHVIVTIDETSVFKLALALYVLPLCAVLLTVLALTALGGNDAWVLVGAILSLIFTFLCLKRYFSGAIIPSNIVIQRVITEE